MGEGGGVPAYLLHRTKLQKTQEIFTGKKLQKTQKIFRVWQKKL
jgi:hypothetical protein